MKSCKRKRVCLIFAASSLLLLILNMYIFRESNARTSKITRAGISFNTPKSHSVILKGHNLTGRGDTQRRHSGIAPRRRFGRFRKPMTRLPNTEWKDTKPRRKHGEILRGNVEAPTQNGYRHREKRYGETVSENSKLSQPSRPPLFPSIRNEGHEKQRGFPDKIRREDIPVTSIHASHYEKDGFHNSVQNHNVFPERRRQKDNIVDSVLTNNKKMNNRKQFVQRKYTLNDNSGHVNGFVKMQPGFKKRISKENFVQNKHASLPRTGEQGVSQDSGQQHNHLIVVPQSPWFVHSSAVDFSACTYSMCSLSYNVSLLPSARAVVFDAVSLGQTPPKYHPPRQLWVLFVMEPPSRLRYQNPHFERPEWGNVFNLTMSYRHDSDIFSPYGFILPKRDTVKERHSLYKKPSLKAKKEISKSLLHHELSDSVSSLDHFSRQKYNMRVQEENDQRIQTNSNVSKTYKIQNPKTIFHDRKYKTHAQDLGSRQKLKIKNTHRAFREFPKANGPIAESVSTFSPRPEFLHMAARKTRSAVWVVSHCQADSARDQYVRRLQRHLDVDVYGKCSGRRCGNNAECQRLINSTYRFLLALENSFCQDYVTEKVFNAYSDLHVVPVVRGGAEYSRILPPGTYVDTSDFPSPEALATFLIGLGRDHVTYAQMLQRKNMYYSVQWQWVWPFPWCRLCEVILDSQRAAPGSRVYPDMPHWISGHACWPAPDLP